MTPEAQRIAIAEACGWKRRADLDYMHVDEWRKIWERDGYLTHNLPDYLNDLNAMHKAEGVLTDSAACLGYEFLLREITERDQGPSHWMGLASHATAAQRAEAFLRTLNLWRDET